MSRRPHALPATTAAVMLLIALGNHPYGYYTLLRWVVTVAAVTVAWVAFESRLAAFAWFFLVVACLFNPIAPVYLKRHTWRFIDIAVALCFLGALTLKHRMNEPHPPSIP